MHWLNGDQFWDFICGENSDSLLQYTDIDNEMIDIDVIY